MKKIYTNVLIYSVLLLAIMQVQAKPTTDSTYQKNLKKFAQILKSKPKQIVFNYEVTPDGDFFFKEYINGEDNSEHILPVSSDTASYSELYLDAIRELVLFNDNYNAKTSSDLKLYVFHGRYFLGHTFYTQKSSVQNEKNLKKVIGSFNRENKDQITQNKNISTLQKDLVQTIKESSNAPERIFILFIVENYETRYKNKKGALFTSQKYFFIESGLSPEEKTAACLAEQKTAIFVEGWENDYKRMNTSGKIIRTYIEAFYKHKSTNGSCQDDNLPMAKQEEPMVLEIAKQNNYQLKALYLLNKTEDTVKRKINDNEREKLPVIHLASHGIYENVAGMLYTHTDIGDDCQPLIRKPERKNGQITYGEILNLKIGSPELVVLNACETRLGVNSVADAFHEAGAQSVIGTSNIVKDDAGYLFANLFYTNYLKTPQVEEIPEILLKIRNKMRSETALKNWTTYTLTSSYYNKAKYEANGGQMLSDNQAIIKIHKVDNEYKAQIITKDSWKSISLGTVTKVMTDIELSAKIIRDNGLGPKENHFWGKIEEELNDSISELFIIATNNFLYQTNYFNFNGIYSLKKGYFLGIKYKITYLL
ncbi:hypothetical protein AD998_21435 [bacterium 336/3]|nr:hypothetical protein AD998_21435 [bacterium 336/3]